MGQQQIERGVGIGREAPGTCPSNRGFFARPGRISGKRQEAAAAPVLNPVRPTPNQMGEAGVGLPALPRD